MTELTLEEALALLKVEVPDTPAKAGWYFDTDALTTSCGGLEFPVRVRYMSGHTHHGTHYAREAEPGGLWPYWHRITLNQTLELEQANKTFWHEIAHAYQSEAWAKKYNKPLTSFYEAYIVARGRWGAAYQENAYEIQARKFAEKRKDVMLLEHVQ